ncbi:uncharacterized protein PRCAT00002345001 [Priceomyces carsonii]|uniref:uncharacterized protein n=1 Tax=Priceomyces carsonii TaxID=28549 RepID=UPI002ED8A516|nr:unnamed protein product [Priceomyces carsonii]
MTFDSLSFQSGRLLTTIHDTASKFGAKGVWGPEPTETGVCRLALSDYDKQVRDWFIEETKSLGCKIKVDEIGNIFAIYPGKKEGPPIGIGSHLDTQPNGGRYDGIYGVLSGLEVIRTLHDNKYVPNYPIAVIDWTNEEGARFPRSIVASGLWADLIEKEDALGLKSITDNVPVTIGEELKRIGYSGKYEASYKSNPLAAHFEIHIEQGPVLETEQKKIGIVTGVQAYAWYTVTVKGRSSHAGTTPMKTRSDALQIASKMILEGIEIAEKHDGLATIGTLTLEPALVNVIPDKVTFTLDARHVYDEKLKNIIDEIKSRFKSIAEKSNGTPFTKPLEVEFSHIYTSPAVHFNETNIKVVKESALEHFPEDEIREIVSGAGHDSCSTSVRVPTSMIFIPSKNGISHNPEEYSSPEEVENGFKVLLSTILKYDEMRAEKKV